MEWVDRLNQVMAYIEHHLDADIRNEEIERIAACPIGSFQRTFSHMNSITLTEYIRRRRMTKAAFDLQSSRDKVVDIALRYGYESADAFTVAFKRVHGVSPLVARQKNCKLKSFPRLSFSLSVKGDVEMNYRVVEREAFIITGRVVTSNLHRDITGEFWGQCKADGTVKALQEVGVTPYTLGVCFGYNEDGYNDYMVAVETENDLTKGMKTVFLPGSTWLVFESVGPLQPTLPNTWQRIYSEFLPQSIYSQSCLPTMERYFTDDVTADDYLVEIWIPVVKK